MAGAPELRYFEIQLLQLDPGAVVSLGLAESGGALALLAHGLHPGWHSGPWSGSTQASRGAHCRRAVPAARAEVPAACCCTASCACLESPSLSLRLPGAPAHESRPCTAAACLLPLPVERAPLSLSLGPAPQSVGWHSDGRLYPASPSAAGEQQAGPWDCEGRALGRAWGAGSVVGCGVDLHRRCAFFTLDGQLVGAAATAPSAEGLRPGGGGGGRGRGGAWPACDDYRRCVPLSLREPAGCQVPVSRCLPGVPFRGPRGPLRLACPDP